MATLAFQPAPNDPRIQISDHRTGETFHVVLHGTAGTAVLTGPFPGPSGGPRGWPHFPTGGTGPTFPFPPSGTLTAVVHYPPGTPPATVEKSLGEWWQTAKNLIGGAGKLIAGLGGGKGGGGGGDINVTVTGGVNVICIGCHYR